MMLTTPHNSRSRISDVLLSLAQRCLQETVTLRDLLDRLGDRTFGIALIVIAAFNVIPFVSIFSGLLVAAIGIQLFAGLPRPYFPARLLDRPLPGKRIHSALILFSQKVSGLEKFVRPRWLFTESPIVDRINGLMIALLGILIALPIPFTNMGPAIVIIVLALGLLERDGVVQILAIVLGFGTMSLMYALLMYGIVG